MVMHTASTQIPPVKTEGRLVQRLALGLVLATALSIGHAAPRQDSSSPRQEVRLTTNQLSTGSSNGLLLYSVPEGKRLVVTSMFVLVIVGSGQSASGHLAACSISNCEAFFPYVLSEQATVNGQTNFVSASSASFYVNGGENLHMGFSRPAGYSDAWRVRTTVMGYLEDAPL